MDWRRYRGVALIVAVLCLLNAGPTAESWLRWSHSEHGALDSMTSPVRVLYRRLGVEELYFAVANAVLGREYDRAPFGGRGDSPFPPIDVPADGHWHAPYVEVPLEYPPPNLPFVIGPAIVTSDLETYMRLFALVMGALLLGSALIAVRVADDEREARLVGFALLLLAHGALAIQCLDAIVALLLVLVVDATVRKRDFALGFWAGLVFAAKFIPVAVAVAALVASGVTWRELRARVPRLLGGGTLGAFIGLGPLVLGAPSALGTLLRYHGDRGLHVESSLGVIYGTVKAIAGMPEKTRVDYGSFNFHGAGSLELAKASSLLLLALIAAAIFAARPASNDDRTKRIVLAALATTIALWLGGKVFSPQYLTWALPLVIAIPGRAWRRVALAFGVVLILSQAYLRGYYDQVRDQHAIGLLTLLLRLALLGGGFALLLRELRRPRLLS